MDTNYGFLVRPAYHSNELLVEICGDHRNHEFPNVEQILQVALNAKQEKHPVLDEVKIAMATDEFFSYWSYSGGNYEIDDDIWGLFISAKDNNKIVISDIEKALVETGIFIKEQVNFADYA